MGSTIRIRLASGGGQEETIPTPNDPATLLSPQLRRTESRWCTRREGAQRDRNLHDPVGDGKASAVVPPPAPPARIVQEVCRRTESGWLKFHGIGREEVYVTHDPSGEGTIQVSQSGETFPSWSDDGKEISSV